MEGRSTIFLSSAKKGEVRGSLRCFQSRWQMRRSCGTALQTTLPRNLTSRDPLAEIRRIVQKIAVSE
jgi:hypothetical protein